MFGEGPTAYCFDYFRSISKQNPKYDRSDKSIRRNTIVVPKAEPILAESFSSSTHRFRGIEQIITSSGGKFPESYHRSPFSVVATVVLPAQQMAKRSRPFTDGASKYTGASSKSKPVGKRVLALQHRIISSSMFNDITIWESQKVQSKCQAQWDEVATYAARFRLGYWCFSGPGSENR